MAESKKLNEFICLVTTSTYAPGAVCLAQSLALVGSRAHLRVIATNEAAAEAVSIEYKKCTIPPPLILDLRETKLPDAIASENGRTHGSKGAVLSVDGKPRLLYKICLSFF